MGKTKIKLDKQHFTKEVTTAFLKDHAIACKTMNLEDFVELFNKYDLSFVEDFNDIFETIKEITGRWYKPDLQTELIGGIEQFDSKCIFCEFGKKVNVYKWTYYHKQAPVKFETFVSRIGFTFNIKDNQLIEYGVCNAFLDKDDMNRLDSSE